MKSTEQAGLRAAPIGLGSLCAGVHQLGLRLIPGVEGCTICDTDAGRLARRSEE